ncbi:hypothetical protein BEWA_000620 [Theileria equi strain WA]|uniref:Uncharacterized protein n=1 Tax=Theileria equi strain WA TaxID=1537102 RepID=L0AYI6_THEEQ|nr:hypothetical protein BEWA_000620 [Theileria equi strain WA]AFZ80657.1 hypothetical protein BEWA_000620 [Theileria equi strain WA]|eukprot:XP_004830323.1 hypothetical protein BEWA_000620 [Theileria equi strain WA]
MGGSRLGHGEEGEQSLIITTSGEGTPGGAAPHQAASETSVTCRSPGDWTQGRTPAALSISGSSPGPKPGNDSGSNPGIAIGVPMGILVVIKEIKDDKNQEISVITRSGIDKARVTVEIHM